MSKNNSKTDKRMSAGQWDVAWRRYRKNKVGLFGTAIVFLFVFAAIFGPYITAYEARSIDSLFATTYWVIATDSCGNSDSVGYIVTPFVLETSLYSKIAKEIF